MKNKNESAMRGSQWDHLSGNNKLPCGCKSILNAHVTARLAIKDNMEAMRRGQMPNYDPKNHEICHRYAKEFTLIGGANRKKSTDGIY